MDTVIQDESAVGPTTHRSGGNRQPRTVGHLAGEVCLAVHSHQALRLIWGRRRTAQKPPISGLIAFAAAVNTVWQAAEGGDPYAYRAAHMLGEYDALVRTCHTLRFVGAGEPAELQTMVARAGHHIRRVFAIPQRFKVCAIDRDDMRQRNQRAQRAVQLTGPLPEEILNGETLPLFVPTGVRHTPGAGSTAIFECAQPRDREGADEATCDAEDEMPS